MFDKIPHSVSWEDLDHLPHEFDAFSPDYTSEELGVGNYELTCTLLGHQLGEDAAIILINRLSHYLSNVRYHENLKAKAKKG